MKNGKYGFTYQVFTNSRELKKTDEELLEKARNISKKAYAPYSKFFVGAAARLTDGTIVTGTNQENASFPVGICAERVLLSTISSMFPGSAIDTMAISYSSRKEKSNHPISPCGMCRQALQEAEHRMERPIRLILSGQEGEIYVIKEASSLLPLAFTSEELK